jgi:Galactose-1-phosphate uridylyltransferase
VVRPGHGRGGGRRATRAGGGALHCLRAGRLAIGLRADDRTKGACRRLHALDDDDLAAATATLQRTLGALDALGDPPYNLILHTAPADERLDQTFHWHWELHPRLRVIAGLERATALAVNPAAPEYAAEVLRQHLQRGSP